MVSHVDVMFCAVLETHARSKFNIVEFNTLPYWQPKTRNRLSCGEPLWKQVEVRQPIEPIVCSKRWLIFKFEFFFCSLPFVFRCVEWKWSKKYHAPPNSSPVQREFCLDQVTRCCTREETSDRKAYNEVFRQRSCPAPKACLWYWKLAVPI